MGWSGKISFEEFESSNGRLSELLTTIRRSSLPNGAQGKVVDGGTTAVDTEISQLENSLALASDVDAKILQFIRP